MKAIVFIDVQNDFVTGSLGSEWAQKVAPKIIEFANECRDKGYVLFATKDSHTDDYFETLEGKRLLVEHCKYCEHGYDLIDNLQKSPEGKLNILTGNIIDKPTFGSFKLLYKFHQWFDEKFNGYDNSLLDSKTIISPAKGGLTRETLDEIIICRFVTSICVISNALMLRAKYPNVKITVMKDLCADVNQESHEAALKVMQNCQIDIQ